ncbi:MAG: hypothetical protein WAZ12_01265 [Candidatus Absconditicoccaceae bacterium]
MENKELIYYPILDGYREKALEIEKQIKNGLYKNLNITSNEQEANAYLVGGGDGFMLDTVKKYYDFNKSPEENKLFFGVNCGTLGFLLNNIQLDDIPSTTEGLEIVKAHLMKVEIIKNDLSVEIKHAINDVVIGGNILDYFKFDINSQQIKTRFHGTGIMVSTAMGSSAYRLNNGGPMMPAESKVWGVSGLASLPFGYKIIRPEDVNIKIKGRSPVMVGVDGYGGKVEEVKELTISPTDHYAKIVFSKGTSFDTKRMLLAEEKLLREDF